MWVTIDITIKTKVTQFWICFRMISLNYYYRSKTFYKYNYIFMQIHLLIIVFYLYSFV
jgi:hypothetical protein